MDQLAEERDYLKNKEKSKQKQEKFELNRKKLEEKKVSIMKF